MHYKLPVRQNFFHKLVTCKPITCNFLLPLQVEKDDIMQKTRNKKVLTGAIHVLGWGIFFALPFFFYRGEGVSITLNRYLGYCFVPLSCLIIFYTNFLWLIERQLFRRKVSTFILSNIVLVMLLGVSLHFWQDFHRKHLSEPVPETMKELQASLPKPPRYVFIARDMMLMALTVALSVAIKMTGGWYETENEKQELKKAQAEAELQNLKSQLNPHFLFNTLNNIYSLIAINQDKAQYAVHDLSRMLRHVLYENNQHFVLVDKEFEFMKSYIELMSLRLPKSTRLEVSIPERSNGTMIAPLLFIPLIENAFKHGVSSTQESFINIKFELQGNNRLNCLVENSNYPKKDNDRSGSGIGLTNLKRRLELLYPGKYIFKAETLNDRFITELLIQL